MALIAQLLSEPWDFPRETPFDFGVFHGIRSAVTARCESHRRSGSVLISKGLQQLVEMCVLAQVAERIMGRGEQPPRPFDVRTAFTAPGIFSSAKLKVPVTKVSVPPAKDIPLLQQLVDVYDIATCINAHARLPDHITCSVAANVESRTPGTPMPITSVRDATLEDVVRSYGLWA